MYILDCLHDGLSEDQINNNCDGDQIVKVWIDFLKDISWVLKDESNNRWVRTDKGRQQMISYYHIWCTVEADAKLTEPTSGERVARKYQGCDYPVRPVALAWRVRQIWSEYHPASQFIRHFLVPQASWYFKNLSKLISNVDIRRTSLTN